jgi:hypothetical protein
MSFAQGTGGACLTAFAAAPYIALIPARFFGMAG